MADETETRWTTSSGDAPPGHENTAFESQPDSMPPVIRGWHARPAPWQMQFGPPRKANPWSNRQSNCRTSPLTTEDDLNLLRIAVDFKDRFTTMKGNYVLYEAIAKEHSAILAVPETSRPKRNATEDSIFEYAGKIYEALQEHSVAEARRKDLVARAVTKAQTHTDSVRDDRADELVQRARDKRPRSPENSPREENERPKARPRRLPPSPSPSSPSL
ncbi:hypothetical protein N7519_011369 [Penicillium mononematosum]|uniref:uncharacterized protein n=1 Tax=Penicillium mononematosum TaxID=268346 RepID=UPI002549A327|nr:uncharacterized protein N7519_011369 [Penicillium mononematosum]KAJ6180908.1 hypothetical protein N7519_011369 [Penicillium mononematosum]